MRGVIHIGPAKTGTSTIQALLRRNAERLREAGIFVPTTRTAVHREFRFLCLEGVKQETQALAKWGITSDAELARLQPTLRSRVEGWLAEAAAAGCSTFVVSCEGFAGMDAAGVGRLRALMAPHCREGFTVVAFLRRQDLLLNSLWKNNARRRGDRAQRERLKGVDYEALLERWATVFGAEAVRPEIFPDSLPGFPGERADLVETFLRAAALPLAPSALELPGRRNAAWDHRAVAIMAAVNAVLPPLRDGAIPPERTLIEEVLAGAFPEAEPFRMPLQRARRVLRRQAESNAAVARRWFGRDRLFHEDLSHYDEGPQPAATLEDCARVMVALAERATGSRRRRRRKAAAPD